MRRLLALLAGLAFAAPSFALTFTVNSIGNDSDDNPGDGLCRIASDATRCTLRAAIEEANARPGVDTIAFSIGPTTILVSGSALPTITDGLIIDGTTAPGYNTAATLPENAPPSVYLSGISLGGTARGLRANGSHALWVYALGIVNFPGNGIEISGNTAARLDRNWIGLDRTGGAAGNGGSGVHLQNCDRCVLGQTFSDGPSPSIVGIGNIVSSNALDGVYMLGGSENLVAGNLIGLHPGFALARGNGRHGVQVISPDARIGNLRGVSATLTLTTPNYIHHNAQDGVYVFGGGARIYTNDIRYNVRHGVNVYGSNNNVGFVNENMRNRINANGGSGVVIGGLDASGGNRVQHNWIWDNDGRGAHVTGGRNNELLNNTIWSNKDDAVRFDANENTVFDNDIGMTFAGLAGNAANGVVLNGNANTVRYNRIGGMADDGIDVVAGSDNFLWGNRIGVTDSNFNMANANVGIRVRSAASATRILGNRIGFNLDGIHLDGSLAQVCDNRIGLGGADEPVGNLSEGIRLVGANNTIGNPAADCAGNRIGHNGSDGIQVENGGNLIRGNALGGDAASSFGNGMGGVLFTAGSNTNTLADNVIRANGGAGVRVGLLAGTGNRIVRNTFVGNVGLPIDLREDGVTPNDAGDLDEGPNRLQNFPVLTAINGGLGELTISYRVDTDLARGDYPLSVDFYVNGIDQRGGEFVFRDTYAITPNSVRTVSFAPPTMSGFVMAMVTDSDGNSSELSAPLPYSFLPLPMELFRNGFEP
jgi:CSLREA domain-containing protein